MPPYPIVENMVKNIGVSAVLGLFSSLLFIFSFQGGDGATGQVNALQTIFAMTLSVLPLFVAGLGWGLTGGFAAVVTGSLIAALLIAPLFSLTYVLTCGLPVLVLTRQSLLWRKEDEKVTWYPVSNLMVCWMFVSILLSGMAVSLLYLNPELKANLTDQFNQIVPQLQKQGEMFKSVTAEMIVRLLPQFFGPFWGIVLMIGGALAQSVLVRFKKNMRPSPAFQELRLPVWVVAATIGAFAFSFFFSWGDAILGAVTLTLEIAFFLQGMAIIHKVSKSWNYRSVILTAVYLSMILIFWLVLVVVLLGLVDNWVGVRERSAPHPNQEED